MGSFQGPPWAWYYSHNYRPHDYHQGPAPPAAAFSRPPGHPGTPRPPPTPSRHARAPEAPPYRMTHNGEFTYNRPSQFVRTSSSGTPQNRLDGRPPCSE